MRGTKSRSRRKTTTLLAPVEVALHPPVSGYIVGASKNKPPPLPISPQKCEKRRNDPAPSDIHRERWEVLLRLFLFLLTNADLVHGRLLFVPRLPVKARRRFFQITVEIGALGHYSHHRGGIITIRACHPKTLNIRNTHNSFSLPQRARPHPIPGSETGIQPPMAPPARSAGRKIVSEPFHRLRFSPGTPAPRTTPACEPPPPTSG